MDKIAVLIPCYNESKTIKKVVEDFKKVLPEATIYVYDNNSSDDTVEIAEKAGAIVRHEYQQGKGNVIRRMFREIDAECYVMTDGDDTYPAEFAREMVDKVLCQPLYFLFPFAAQNRANGYQNLQYHTIHDVMSLYIEISSIRRQPQLLQVFFQMLHTRYVLWKTSLQFGKLCRYRALHLVQTTVRMADIHILQAYTRIEIVHWKGVRITLAIEPYIPQEQWISYL